MSVARVDRLRRQVATMVAGRGDITHAWADHGNQWLLVAPRDEASNATPIAIRFAAEEATIEAGLGSLTLLPCADEEEERELLAYIAAIIDGRAREFVARDESRPTFQLAVQTSEAVEEMDEDTWVFVRELAAWPDRPVHT